MSDGTPQVVIVGSGFGGTNAAHALRHAPVRVTVIDRTFHSFFLHCYIRSRRAAFPPTRLRPPFGFCCAGNATPKS